MSTYDIYIQGTSGDDAKPVSFGYTAAVAVTGGLKVVNRYLKCLLTPKGSDPVEPHAGTDFTSLREMNVVDEQDLLDTLSIIVRDCNEQMRAQDHTNRPPLDETFGDASVVKVVDLGGGDYDAWLRLRNGAGKIQVVQLTPVRA